MPISDAGGAPANSGSRTVTCPICLASINWGDLEPYRWDQEKGEYVANPMPQDINEEQKKRFLRTVSWKCPNPVGDVAIHFLPDAYGQHGEPVVFGFIGASRSGKTHLLASMIGAIESGELSRYGLKAIPVDRGRHRTFMAECVQPLLNSSVVLSPTEDNIINFADAFLIGRSTSDLRPIAIFDVAGEELRRVDDAKRFLDVANGFVFVVDPDQFGKSKLGDLTFNAVLEILQSSGKLESTSTAIVLNKADQLRFDEPVALWMRRGGSGLDPEKIRQESADVYAYLHAREAGAWARPFRECGKGTLHFASATGGAKGEGSSDIYPRGVRPQRVLAPLLSLMAMTGVLSAPGVGA